MCGGRHTCNWIAGYSIHGICPTDLSEREIETNEPFLEET
jgi:hypothetical protein